MAEENNYQARFGGIGRLVGRAALDRLQQSHVCVVGVGGVGSWTVEALARSGVGRLTLVDLDEVCVSNINRQLPALTREIGKPKVQVLQERVMEINPECHVDAVEEFFTAASAERLLEPEYDYIVDAIDSLVNKCLLLALSHKRNRRVITVGGAGGRQDPTMTQIADLALATNDRLLRSVRKVLRAEYGFPRAENAPFGIPSVFSREAPAFPQPDGTVCPQRVDTEDLGINCNSGFGSATYVTGTFGFIAAARVVRDLASGPSAP